MRKQGKLFFGIIGIIVTILMIFIGTSYFLNEGVNLSPAQDCNDCLGFLSSMTKVQKTNGLASIPPLHIARENKIKDYFINPDLRMMKDDTQTFIVAFYNNEPGDFSLDYTLKKNGVESDEFEIELYKMEYANVTRTDFNNFSDLSTAGYYLDPLLSYQRNEIVNSAESVFWWVTLRSKEGTSAGGYRFEANVDVDGQTKNKGFDFIVYNYTMPGRSILQFYLGLKFFEETEGYPGYMPLDYHHAQTNAEKQEVIDNYMSYLSKNKISATHPYVDPVCIDCIYMVPHEPQCEDESCFYDYSSSFNLEVTNLTDTSITINYTNFDKQMEKYFDEGRMNTFSLGTTVEGFYRIRLPAIWGNGQSLTQQSPEEYDRIMRLYWTNVSEHLRERGWINYSIIDFDEPFARYPERDETGIYQWNYFTNIFRDVNTETKLIVYLSNNINSTFWPYIIQMENIDVYSPLEYIPRYSWANGNPNIVNPRSNLTPLINNLMDEDDEIGTYWTNNQHMRVDRPGIDNRIFGMKYWSENVTALHHWNVLQFVYTNSTGDIVNNNTWRSISHRWGAGGSTLFYPPCKTGRCDTFNANITPSVRSELFREALEDYNALEEMEKLIKKAELNGVNTNEARNTLDKFRKLADDYANWTNLPSLDVALANSTRNITYFEDLHRELIINMINLENEIQGFGRIISSNPPTGAIDARIPYLQGNPATTYGWTSVNLIFSDNAESIDSNSFSIITLGGATSPAISSISQGNSQNEIVINFDRKLSPGNRTVIKHLASNTQVCLGYLPGDVNGNGVTNTLDNIEINDILNAYQSSGVLNHPLYSVDIDRQGSLAGLDSSTHADILGGFVYGAWNGRSLAACPCGNGIIDSGEQCDDGNFENGDGCNNQCKIESYKVFVTEETHDGNFEIQGANGGLSGIEGADKICDDSVHDAGLEGKWKAWISDSDFDATERLFHSNIKYTRMDGEIIANNWTDLTDGSLDNPMKIDQFGNLIMGINNVWTGTNIYGYKKTVNCQDWSRNTLSSGFIGNVLSMSSTWTEDHQITCGNNARLYCIEQPWCGNGIRELSEQCDDGNTQNGDSCSSSCIIGLGCNTDADEEPYGNCDGILTCDELDSFIDNYYINGVSINKVSEAVLEYLTNPVCP